jgi:hypothetical protein
VPEANGAEAHVDTPKWNEKGDKDKNKDKENK